MSDSDAPRAARSGSSLVIIGSQQSGAPVLEAPEEEAPELTEADLRAARRVFEVKLRGRVHPRWVEENADDLFAKAQQQYAEWLDAGRVADCPRAWLVHCAWRRSQDLLDYEKRRGVSVPIEDVDYSLADESTPTPEQVLLEGDRREQLLDALGELKPEHRELLKLVYFDNLEVREAGEILGWTAANASYHHKAVLKRLRTMLDGKIELPEIGSAAAVIVAIERFDAFSVWRLVESAGDAATAAVHRLGELGRRLLPASDPANASIAGGAVRAAGVCGAAAAAVCLATGVVGPGVGAVGLGGTAPIRETDRNPIPAERPDASTLPTTTSHDFKTADRDRRTSAARAAERRSEARTARETQARAQRRRTSRPARSGGEDQINAEAVAEPAYSEPVQPHPNSEEESASAESEAPSSGGGSSGRETSPATEFGL